MRNKSPLLLTRDAFREAVFSRDDYTCVNCGAHGDGVRLDAHHIIERRLFPDGGYYLENGVTLCDPRCHMLAEMTVLSPDDLRRRCGIEVVVAPPHLYSREYALDKWGNYVLPNGRRLPGDLFFDESVQKVLRAGDVLDLFDPYVRYPRTWHLPWSPGASKDDRILPDVSCFEGKIVSATIKWDGENGTMTRDRYYARSPEGDSHPSQSYARALHARIAHEIPPGWRICGENLYARHSIAYDDLEGFFYVFSMWNERNECLPRSECVQYADILGLPMALAFYEGPFDHCAISAAFRPYADRHEGYVVANVESFRYADFHRNVAKYVRANHVHDTVHNWRSGWYDAPHMVNALRRDSVV